MGEWLWLVAWVCGFSMWRRTAAFHSAGVAMYKKWMFVGQIQPFDENCMAKSLLKVVIITI